MEYFSGHTVHVMYLKAEYAKKKKKISIYLTEVFNGRKYTWCF